MSTLKHTARRLSRQGVVWTALVGCRPNAKTHLPPIAGARHERRLLAVRYSARLCENSLLGTPRLCKLLIFLDSIFKKLTFHTVSCRVRLSGAQFNRLERNPEAIHHDSVLNMMYIS